MEPIHFNVRCWQYGGDTGLEDMVRGISAGTIRDGRNKPSADEIQSGCMAIVICRAGSDYFAHLCQIIGKFEGDPDQVWDLSRSAGPGSGETYAMQPITNIHIVPADITGEIYQAGVDRDHRAGVVRYLLSRG